MLLRLCEPGAVMAVARDMETAVIVRETPDGEQLRTALVEREIAQALALKDWISCPDTSGRVSRYFITNAGRAALRALTAQSENAAVGFSDARRPMKGMPAWDHGDIDAGDRSKSPAIESPLIGLARRKDKDDSHFWRVILWPQANDCAKILNSPKWGVTLQKTSLILWRNNHPKTGHVVLPMGTSACKRH